MLNTVNYYSGPVPKVPKLKIKNFPAKCMQLSRCDFMSMCSLHCLIMFHMHVAGQRFWQYEMALTKEAI